MYFVEYIECVLGRDGDDDDCCEKRRGKKQKKTNESSSTTRFFISFLFDFRFSFSSRIAISIHSFDSIPAPRQLASIPP